MSEGSQPAFPCTEQHGCNSGWFGMTLRDYFAAKVLTNYATVSSPMEVSSYAVADAMLKERDKYK